tara:strand:+ start:1477 stop:1656 length:180 start_codon:yes stop_codon:yes gene_type:complete
MSTQEELRSFVFSILDDDEGITEEAWRRLMDYLQSVGEMELIGELISLVKSCNGRRYIV